MSEAPTQGRRDGHDPDGPRDTAGRPDLGSLDEGMPAYGYALEDSLGYLVNQAARSIRRRFDEELVARDVGVAGEQFGVLVHLWRLDGQHQKDLAATLAKDKTTMARLVQGLEARGLVVREPDPEDMRHKRVYLSERGRADMGSLLDAATAVLDQIARSVDPRDLAVCKDVLRAVQRALAKGREDAAPALGGTEKRGEGTA